MTPSQALPAVLDKIDADFDSSVARLFDFLKIQSISTDPAYKEHCRAAAEFVAKDLAGLGFDASLRPTGGHPVVIGKCGNDAGNGKAPRVLFYGHYDVQPVDPLDLWQTPPFAPRIATLPDGCKIIVARGACDDKGQVMTFVEALRAFKAVTGTLPLPITMMIEGEEECGSEHLFGFVKDNAAELKLDLALVCDTSMWDAATPAITTSLRGLVYEEVKLTCADRDLHSGIFGGAAANPLRLLARILAGLHDDNGQTLYDLRYIAQNPGEYDLRNYLEHLDGAKLTDGPSIPVHVTSILPKDHKGDLFGAVLAKSLKIGNQSLVHYDESLRGTGGSMVTTVK